MTKMKTESDGYPNQRVNNVIYHQNTSGFTQQDWLDLALAALDQLGCDAALQERIDAMLPMTDGEP